MTSCLQGIIFYDDNDDATNTNLAPTGAYLNCGWQNLGKYRGFHATMISPKHFITAGHFGIGGTTFTQPAIFNGGTAQSYTIKNNGAETRIQWTKSDGSIAYTDLVVFEICETFPSYSELYTGSNDLNKEFVMTGAGVGRGTAVTSNGQVRGWKWGSLASRWGVNDVDSVYGESDGSTLGDLLYCDFDGVNGQFECQAGSGDSGGAWFINDGGNWKLAGVNYSVDGSYDTNNTTGDGSSFSAAMFDARSFYYGSDNGWFLIPDRGYNGTSGYLTDRNDIRFYRRSHTYASRISSNSSEILAVIQNALDEADFTTQQKFDDWLSDSGVVSNAAETDDADGDGVNNLFEYLMQTDPSDAASSGCVMEFRILENGDHEFTVVEPLDIGAMGLSWSIESSSTLSSGWAVQGSLTEISNVADSLTCTRTRVLSYTPSATGKLFYRLKVDADF